VVSIIMWSPLLFTNIYKLPESTPSWVLPVMCSIVPLQGLMNVCFFTWTNPAIRQTCASSRWCRCFQDKCCGKRRCCFPKQSLSEQAQGPESNLEQYGSSQDFVVGERLESETASDVKTIALTSEYSQDSESYGRIQKYTNRYHGAPSTLVSAGSKRYYDNNEDSWHDYDECSSRGSEIRG
jgi:hypothetical protein